MRFGLIPHDRRSTTQRAARDRALRASAGGTRRTGPTSFRPGARSNS